MKTLLILLFVMSAANARCMSDLFDYYVSDIYQTRVFRVYSEREKPLPAKKFKQVKKELNVTAIGCPKVMKTSFYYFPDEKRYELYRTFDCREASMNKKGVITDSWGRVIGYSIGEKMFCLNAPLR